MESLLGEKVQGKSGDVAVSSFNELDTVGLYFSAHWCGPCRGFTPQLAKKYNELKAEGKKFEIVFVSSDRDDAAFSEYFKEQPWCALPFANRKLKAKLSKKFKVQGIPTLVFVNPKDGSFNDDGRSAIMSGKVDGKECVYPFPAIPKPTFDDVFKGAEFVGKNQNGEPSENKKSLDDLKAEGCKYLMLYFSAHWCPPCRGFTPKLAEWYKKNVGNFKGGDRQFELAFISSDRDENAFKSYFKEDHADWLALDYANRSAKAEISSYFEVQGIPTLAVVELDTGKTITTAARGGIQSDPEGAEFPWKEKPIDYLNGSNIGNVNEYPMMIVFADNGCSADQHAACLEAATPAATGIAQAGEESGEDVPLKFAVEKGDSGFADRLRSTLAFAKGEQVVAIFDLESRKGWFSKKIKEMKDVTKENIDEFVKHYLDEDNRESTLNHVEMKL